MTLLSRLTMSAVLGGLLFIPQGADAQRRGERDDDRRAREVLEHRNNDDRWDDDDDRWDDDDERRARRGPPAHARGRNDDWARKNRKQREKWCRKRPDDRRCDDFFRRDDNRAWCWDRNRDGRCDAVNTRRRDGRDRRNDDWRRVDRGPQWERWLRANGLDLGQLVNPR